MRKILITTILLIGLGSSAFAKDIYVKYRGTVDVSKGHFQHLSLKSSSFINDMYYDSDNNYLLVQLRSTYYHYCSIPQSVVSDWRGSSSLGRYYNYNIKGNYDCRINPVPKY
jgi:hypothetical protein